MTDVHDIVTQVETSPEFAAFTRSNPHHYLVHAFSSGGPIELGYYSKESDRTTVFKTAPVQAMPPEEVFKEQGALERLDLSAVRLGLREALARAEQERAGAYPHHAAVKTICVLQQHGQPIWNMTLVTATLQMINMKIDATTGIIISREMRSIMDLAQ